MQKAPATLTLSLPGPVPEKQTLCPQSGPDFVRQREAGAVLWCQTRPQEEGKGIGAERSCL